LVTVRDTEKVPAEEYVCEGFWVVAELPSPKSQDHAVGDSEEVSVNWTVRGTVPEVGVAENAATGWGTADPSDSSENQ